MKSGFTENTVFESELVLLTPEQRATRLFSFRIICICQFQVFCCSLTEFLDKFLFKDIMI
ncbi:MAG: hypothetical protein BWK80_53010 [Desulfobacteraceae bacterium IS3]|nr:MAG: hypothetical protein BWK80_53010 [Desulfobacteraceae bacterium IS3]